MSAIFQKINLLIVDDNEDLRNVLCDFFAKHGANIFSATNGQDAVQIAMTRKIDLILTDVEMPEMNGIEFIEFIKTFGDHFPLFWLMSGRSEMFEKDACEIGAEGILEKPFDLSFALEKIKKSLEKKQPIFANLLRD